MPKQTAYERGYITRDAASKQLIYLAAQIAARQDGQLVKITVQVHATPDDGSASDGSAITEKTASRQKDFRLLPCEARGFAQNGEIKNHSNRA